MNNNPCQLSKILENVEGEDLDGDGQVTEQEIIETRVRKGKEIFARTFLKENVSRCSPECDPIHNVVSCCSPYAMNLICRPKGECIVYEHAYVYSTQ